MTRGDTKYADAYRNTDFRKHPEKYRVGKGEQGVLMAEPYKSEILPFWRFKTEAIANESAQKIYDLFLNYRGQDDFVGMDMARKFLMMGWTRARRYANHPSGRKYNADGSVKPQHETAMTSEKAKAAAIFFEYYNRANQDKAYRKMMANHKERFEKSANT